MDTEAGCFLDTPSAILFLTNHTLGLISFHFQTA